MFSKRMLLIVGLIFLITLNIIGLTLSSRQRNSDYGLVRVGLVLVSPLQAAVTHSLRFVRGIWYHYFALASVARQNDRLRRELDHARSLNDQFQETETANRRLRELINFQQSISVQFLPAEVIGKDPSPWFKALTIDKGRVQGVVKGLPVVTPQGIAGQVTDVSDQYAKVLLIIDQNNAVDAIVQRSRARGIVTGTSDDRCIFKYVLRKDDVRVGDILVSSGLDGVFPKGLRVGSVSGVYRQLSGIFQEVTVTPFVDFDTLEEVLVVRNPPRHKFAEDQ